MTAPTLYVDSDGYPTDERLRQVREAKVWTRDECAALLEAVRGVWAYAAAGYWEQNGDRYELSTAGWSGNESLIEALQENRMFWHRCWESVRRGGHYVFELPEAE